MAKNKIKMMLSALVMLAVSIISCSAEKIPSDDGGGTAGGGMSTIADMIPSEPLPLNSHAGEEKWSVLQPMYDHFLTIPHKWLTGDVPEEQRTAMYPRIKRMANGEYIMFYHGGQLGSRIWSTTSKDFKNWTEPKMLYAPVSVTVNGKQDWRRFVNMDAVVLPDGEILAVCSYRAENHYYQGLGCGLMLIRSKDNGKTWTEPQKIYDGPNWEAFMLRLPDGRLQCYFTDPIPQTRNSGTSIIISEDNGHTWSQKMRVCRRFKYLHHGDKPEFEGQKIYTDQMPCFRVLNDGKTILGFLEARLEDSSNPEDKSYYDLALVWNDGLDWKDLGEESEGPYTRINNIQQGGGGYVATFSSGEVVISGHIKGYMQLKMLDHTGCRNGGTDWNKGWMNPFKGKGMWSCTEVDSPMTLVGAMHNGTGMEMGRFYLNHRITAARNEVKVDGNTSEWKTKEALYISSKEHLEVETILRSGRDNKNMYLLVETLSADRGGNVKVDLLISNPKNKSVTTVKVSSDGSVLLSDKAAESSFSYANASDGREGFVAEISIPLESLKLAENDYVALFASLAAEGAVTTFTMAERADIDTWQYIRID